MEHTTPHLYMGLCTCDCDWCVTITGKCICLDCPTCRNPQTVAALHAFIGTISAVIGAVIDSRNPECEWCGATYDGEELCRHSSLN